MKKSILTMVFAVAAIAMQAQVAELLEHKVDEFTGVQSKVAATKSKNGIVFFMGKFESKKKGAEVSTVALYLKSAPSIGCAGSQDNYAILLFSDKTTIKLDDDISDINCSGSPASCYMLTEEQLDIIMTKKLEKVRVSQSKGYNDHSVDNQDILIDLINITDF